MKVVHGDHVRDGSVSKFVGRSIGHPALDGPSRQPAGIALRVVVPAIVALSKWGSAKFTGTDQQCVLPHST